MTLLNSFASLLKARSSLARDRRHRRRMAARQQTARSWGVDHLEGRTLLAVDVGWALGLVPDVGQVTTEDIATDADGNVYVTGWFSSVVQVGNQWMRGDAILDFDPNNDDGDGSGTLAGRSAFVAKYEPDGLLAWARALGSDGQEYQPDYAVSQRLAVDGGGNVYVAGYLRGEGLDFGTTAGDDPVTLSTAEWANFLVKLDTEGNTAWARTMPYVDAHMRLDVDAGGTIYTSGDFAGSILLGPTADDAFVSMTSAGGRDGYVTGYDTDGNLLWANQIAGQDWVTPRSLEVHETGVYVGGRFGGAVDFDPGPGTYTLNSGSQGQSSFILKLDHDGSFAWASQLQARSAGRTASGSLVHDLAVGSDGHVVVVGQFTGNVDFDPGNDRHVLNAGNGTHYLVRLDPAGGLDWVRQWGTHTPNQFVSGVRDGHHVAVDHEGGIYVSGGFRGTVDFDPGPGTFELSTSQYLYDADRDLWSLNIATYLSKFDGAGDFLWAVAFDGENEDSWVRSTSIAVDPSGHIILAGVFSRAAVSFDDDGEHRITNPIGSSAAFVVKLIPPQDDSGPGPGPGDPDPGDDPGPGDDDDPGPGDGDGDGDGGDGGGGGGGNGKGNGKGGGPKK